MVDDHAPLIRLLVGMPFGSAQGGAERLLDDFLRHAAAIRVEPHVVFLQDGEWPARLKAKGMAVSVIEPGRFRHLHRNATAVHQLRRLIARERPDAVLSWISRAHILLAPAAIAAGSGGRLLWFQHQTKMLAAERMATLLPSRLVLACSVAAAEAQRSLRPHREVKVTTPGIETPDRLGPAELARLRTELGVPEAATIVGISGRLVRWKNHEALLRAIGRLRTAGRDVHGLVIGGEGHGLDAGYEAELRDLVRSLGIEPHVTFTGFRADSVAVTQLMDVLVNASRCEPFGLSVVEAMALGIPVVASGAAGPAEIIEAGRTGLLVDEPTETRLADALLSLIDDPPLRRKLGTAAREAVLSRYTTRRFAVDVRSALEEVVSS